MSLYIVSKCDKCDFLYAGGYGVTSCLDYPIIQFRCICKNCLNCFSIYSEDLGYIQSENLCYLHNKSLDPKYNEWDKSKQRSWKRSIRKADKKQKKKLKLDRAKLISEEKSKLIKAKVRSGISIQVIEEKGVQILTDRISCPECKAIGKIALGFVKSEICPQCFEGNISNII